MVEKKNKFVEAAHAAHKGKAIAGVSGPPPKWACGVEKIIILPPPPPLPTKELAPTQPKSSLRDTPAVIPVQAESSQEEAVVGVTWSWGIQYMALALT